jgi:hypothetical protein
MGCARKFFYAERMFGAGESPDETALVRIGASERTTAIVTAGWGANWWLSLIDSNHGIIRRTGTKT